MNSEILKNITSNKEDSLLYCMHLPKSGGSHITKLIGNKIGFINGGHQFCIDNIPHNSYNPWTKKGIKVFSNYLYDKNFRRSVTFAVVRNPFDWLSSYFFTGAVNTIGILSIAAGQEVWIFMDLTVGENLLSHIVLKIFFGIVRLYKNS